MGTTGMESTHWASLVPKGGPQCPLLPTATAAPVLLNKSSSTVGRSARNSDCPLTFATQCSEGALRHLLTSPSPHVPRTQPCRGALRLGFLFEVRDLSGRACSPLRYYRQLMARECSQ